MLWIRQKLCLNVAILGVGNKWAITKKNKNKKLFLW